MQFSFTDRPDASSPTACATCWPTSSPPSRSARGVGRRRRPRAALWSQLADMGVLVDDGAAKPTAAWAATSSTPSCWSKSSAAPPCPGPAFETMAVVARRRSPPIRARRRDRRRIGRRHGRARGSAVRRPRRGVADVVLTAGRRQRASTPSRSTSTASTEAGAWPTVDGVRTVSPSLAFDADARASTAAPLPRPPISSGSRRGCSPSPATTPASATVRPADRLVPGGQAPDGRRAAEGRVRPAGRLPRGLVDATDRRADRAARRQHGQGLRQRCGAQGGRRSALQVHGAIGYTWECDLQLFMKKAWALAAPTATPAGTAAGWLPSILHPQPAWPRRRRPPVASPPVSRPVTTLRPRLRRRRRGRRCRSPSAPATTARPQPRRRCPPLAWRSPPGAPARLRHRRPSRPPSSVATAAPAPTTAAPVSTTAGATTDAEATTAPGPPPPAATVVTSTMASAPAVIALSPAADATASAMGPPRVSTCGPTPCTTPAPAVGWPAATPTRPLAVGSLMKLLTAYVVMQAGDPTHVVTCRDDDRPVGIGDRPLPRRATAARDLLVRAMLIVSANDAARALAIDLAGSEEAFAAEMNAAAAAPRHARARRRPTRSGSMRRILSSSTADDMTTLAASLMQDETFRATVACTDATLHGQVFPATNALLTSYPGAEWGEDGAHHRSGWSLVGAAERDGSSGDRDRARCRARQPASPARAPPGLGIRPALSRASAWLGIGQHGVVLERGGGAAGPDERRRCAGRV